MSLTFKLLSLAIRTAAKPIGNYIKRQTKDHEGFRRFAVRQAQRVHQVDMRMRLGILHDAEAQQRMHDREARAAEERKKKEEVPTVRSEAEQKRHEEDQTKSNMEAEKSEGKVVEKKQAKVKIRPLSEAKAIELGANFFSEAFIFAVAAGLLVWDSWRSRAKESARRDGVAERLSELEVEVERLRAKHEPETAVSREVVRAGTETERRYGWYNPAGWWARSEPAVSGGAQGSEGVKVIPGSVPGPSPAEAVKPTPIPSGAPPLDAVKTKEIAPKPSIETRGPASPAEKAPERIEAVVAAKKER
ncbi:hypothetical protein LTR08_006310 [Meristemomyces frigidus]|nr:hypothetical protein LTR08_006310 [Meristemomyces frigidus]